MNYRCACNCGEGVAHRDGCDGIVRPERTGIRIHIPYENIKLDLDSIELASARVSEEAHELRLRAIRLKRALEAREEAIAAHELALREFMRSRDTFAAARSDLAHAEAGYVLTELKDRPLPKDKP